MSRGRYREGDEAVPGYTLVGHLGGGMIGDVWQARTSGGIDVALKICPLSVKAGLKELKALQLVKQIRHTNLVEIHAFWLVDEHGNILSESEASDVRGELTGEGSTVFRRRRKLASEGALESPVQTETTRETLVPRAEADTDLTSDEQTEDWTPAQERAQPAVRGLGQKAADLIIAMTLCEGSLSDLLEQRQQERLDGIPFDELIQHIEDAARAIDFLNRKHQIQHCDIKPQNILLLGDGAQVCDFGVASAIGGGDLRQTSEKGFSPAYAPRELALEQKPCSTTDQYSLAISYTELLTGKNPAGDTVMEVLQAIDQGKLDLSRLEPLARQVIKRATSRNPVARYPSAMEMVAALRDAHDTALHPRPSQLKYVAAGGLFFLVAATCVLAVLVAIFKPQWFGLKDPDGPVGPPGPIPIFSTVEAEAVVQRCLVKLEHAETILARADARDAQLKEAREDFEEIAADTRLLPEGDPHRPGLEWVGLLGMARLAARQGEPYQSLLYEMHRPPETDSTGLYAEIRREHFAMLNELVVVDADPQLLESEPFGDSVERIVRFLDGTPGSYPWQVKASLDWWETVKLEQWKAAAFSRYGETDAAETDRLQDEIRKVWGDDIVFFKRLAHTNRLLNEREFARCRRLLAELSAEAADDETKQKRISVLQTLVDVRDTDTSLEIAIRSYGGIVETAPGEQLYELTAALAKRLLTTKALVPGVVEDAAAQIARTRDREELDLVRRLESLRAQILSRKILMHLAFGQHVEYPELARICGEIRNGRGRDMAETNHRPEAIEIINAAIDACWAEATLLEAEDGLDPETWGRAKTTAEKALAQLSPDRQFADYAHFVNAVVCARQPGGSQWEAAVSHLEQSLGSPALKTEPRRAQCHEIYLGAAENLKQRATLTEPAFTSEGAEKAGRYLTRCRNLSAAEPPQFLYLLALAAAGKSPPDHDAAIDAADRLLSEHRDWLAERNELLRVLLVSLTAHRQRGATDRNIAIERAAELLRLDDQAAVPIPPDARYDQIVEPTLEMAPELSAAPDSIRGDLAELYAAKGRLIREHWVVGRRFHGEDVRAAYEAFDAANRLGATGETLVGQAMALIDLWGDGKRTDIVRITAEIDDLTGRALDIDPGSHGAIYLKGYVTLQNARRGSSSSARRKLMDAAIGYFSRAIAICKEPSEGTALYWTMRSTAQVEAAFLEERPEEKLNRLQQAAADGEQATLIADRPRPEEAWIAWGHAEEDMGHYLPGLLSETQRHAHFEQALICFGKAKQLQEIPGRLSASACLAFGRCQFRQVQDALVAENEYMDDLRVAVAHTEEARSSENPWRKAEACIWSGSIHQHIGQLLLVGTDERKPVPQDAEAEFGKADEAYRDGCQVAHTNADPHWLTYVWIWAKHRYALGGKYYRRGQADAAQRYFELAREMSEKALADAADDDGSSRATSYQLLFDFAVIAVNNPSPAEERLQTASRVIEYFPGGNAEAAPYRVKLLLKRVGLRIEKQKSLPASPDKLKDNLKQWESVRQLAERDLEQANELAKKIDAELGTSLGAECSHWSAQVAVADYTFHALDISDTTNKLEQKARRASQLLDAAQGQSSNIQDCYQDCILLGQVNLLIVNRFARTDAEKQQFAKSAWKALERIRSIRDVGGDDTALRSADNLRNEIGRRVPAAATPP